MTSQIPFDLGLRPALGRDDFLVTASNAAAVTMIDQWPDWPSTAVLIIGAPGSGKSHLVEVFRKNSAAETVLACDLRTENVPSLLANGALVVEDCNAMGKSETALFHALNLARQQENTILLTADRPVPGWTLQLPDLVSRLNATPAVNILPPDDALLRGVLVKQFADRQIIVGEPVITYIVQRIPRSLETVRAIVAEIDGMALAERAEITRPYVARVLSRFTNPALFSIED